MYPTSTQYNRATYSKLTDSELDYFNNKWLCPFPVHAGSKGDFSKCPFSCGPRRLARQAPHPGWSRSYPLRALHGHPECAAVQPSHQGVPPEAGRTGQTQESRHHGLYAEVYYHPEYDGEE